MRLEMLHEADLSRRGFLGLAAGAAASCALGGCGSQYQQRREQKLIDKHERGETLSKSEQRRLNKIGAAKYEAERIQARNLEYYKRGEVPPPPPPKPPSKWAQFFKGLHAGMSPNCVHCLPGGFHNPHPNR